MGRQREGRRGMSEGVDKEREGNNESINAAVEVCRAEKGRRGKE